MLTRRPAIALLAAMAMWAPSFKAFITGAIDVDAVCTRFLVAFAVSYVGVTILGMIVAGYGAPADAVVEPLRRRREDYVETMVSEQSLSSSIIDAEAEPVDPMAMSGSEGDV